MLNKLPRVTTTPGLWCNANVYKVPKARNVVRIFSCMELDCRMQAASHLPCVVVKFTKCIDPKVAENTSQREFDYNMVHTQIANTGCTRRPSWWMCVVRPRVVPQLAGKLS